MKKGLFISFEGIEACGKSTQIPRLESHIQHLGERVHKIREPGGTPLGEEIRHIYKHSTSGAHMSAETELMLLYASRAHLLDKVIRPSLAAGDVVICDRFYDSSLAYQGYGRGVDFGLIRALNDYIVRDTVPDITIYLYVPLQVSLARQGQRADRRWDRMEQANQEFHEKVYNGFQHIAQQNPDRIRTIDGTLSISTVSELVYQAVGALYRRRR